MRDALILPDIYTDALLQIKHLLSDKAVEYSGSVYSDGTFSFNKGQTDSAHISDDSDFLWHSHPDGKLDFSFSDWLCIFYSNATFAALFAGHRILIVKKSDLHKKLQLEFQKITEEFADHRSIFLYKAAQILERHFCPEITEVSERELISKFKIPNKIYKEQDNTLVKADY